MWPETERMRHFRGLNRYAVAVIALCLPAGAALSGSGEHFGPPASPLAATVLETALERDVAAAEIYDTRRGAPVWLDDGGETTPRADALLAALAGAPSHALPAARYDAAGLSSLIDAATDAATAAEAELALTAAFLTYGRDLSSGVLEPRKVSRQIYLKPVRPDPAVLLREVAAAADPAAYLAGLAPQHPDYGVLRLQLALYRGLAEGEGWGALIGDGETIREGDQGARVAALRERLRRLGDLAPEPANPTDISDTANPDDWAPELEGEETVLAANDIVTDVPIEPTASAPHYGPELIAAVKRFQARHGLNTDGLVGPATRAALNTGPRTRLRQIAVNLERLRWLKGDYAERHRHGPRHVVANLADFRVTLFEHDAATFTSRTVVGLARRHETPEFVDEIEHMVVNPTWHVPYSIASEEILPKLREDPTYLESKNMRLVGSDLPASMIDWSLVTPNAFPGRVKQGPGRGNALGRVKFMFPNNHAIYLHDTPQKRLFSRDRRAFSHGCVRVQDAFDFAHALLEPQTDDPVAAFDRWLANGAERWVHLDAHVPVYLVYRTAWVDEAGTEQFRADVYGRDRLVADALIAAGADLPEG